MRQTRTANKAVVLITLSVAMILAIPGTVSAAEDSDEKCVGENEQGPYVNKEKCRDMIDVDPEKWVSQARDMVEGNKEAILNLTQNNIDSVCDFRPWICDTVIYCHWDLDGNLSCRIEELGVSIGGH